MSTYTDWLAVFHRDKGYHPLGDVIFDAGVAEGMRRTGLITCHGCCGMKTVEDPSSMGTLPCSDCNGTGKKS